MIGEGFEGIPLSKQTDVIAAIEKAVLSEGKNMKRACKEGRISTNTFYMWRSLLQEPTIWKLVSLANVSGYEIVMVRDGVEINVANPSEIMTALDSERRRRRMTVIGLEERSGIPNRSWSYWLAGVRMPPMRTMALLAEFLGFLIIMRRKRDVLRSDDGGDVGLDCTPRLVGAA